MSAYLDTKARWDKLSAARELNRAARLMNEHELLQALQNIIAACEFQDGTTDKLIALCCDLDDVCNPVVDDLPYSGRERGEYDSRTQLRSCDTL